MWSRVAAHLKVFGIAIVFGFGVYGIIMVLHAVGRNFGAKM